jgi:hypothetical protein
VRSSGLPYVKEAPCSGYGGPSVPKRGDGLAQACVGVLPDRVRLDTAGWAMEDIFAHS